MTLPAPVYLSNDFVSRYVNKPLPFGGAGLGEFVYTRTYSRWLPEEARRELWHETVRRVVDDSMSLYSGPLCREALIPEAQELFDAIWSLKLFPSGRSMWVAGTESSRKFGESNYNCAFAIMDGTDKFCDLFLLLMVGTGFGFRILPEDVERLPKFNTEITVEHREYRPIPKFNRLESTMVETYLQKTVIVEIGDSKEGWVDALRFLLNTLSDSETLIKRIIFDYDSIRPQGERLQTFGGRASGPVALRQILEKIPEVISRTDGNLSTVDVLDICNVIGLGVVCGGVRRTSQIALGSPDDIKFVEAKLKFYDDPDLTHRSMSNNSVVYDKRPDFGDFVNQMELVKVNGEPGILNAASARKRRPWFEGINPCVTGDTWVLTSDGPKQVTDLAKDGRSFHAVVNGESFKSTKFEKTGTLPVFKVDTTEGYSIRTTGNHQILTSEGWVEASALKPGDSLNINCHRSLSHYWVGKGGEDEGWLVGALVGSGSFARRGRDEDGEPKFGAVLRFRGESRHILHDLAVARLRKTGYMGLANPGRSKSESNLSTIESSGLCHMAGEYGIYSDNRLISKEVMTSSSRFQSEFLMAMYDAHGHIHGTSKNGHTIRLQGSTREELLKVQIMLIHLGVRSRVRQMQPDRVERLPDGKGGLKDYHCKASFELLISADNIPIFARVVGFDHPEKIEKLRCVLEGHSRGFYEKPFTAVVSSVSPDGVEDVYDCAVEEVSQFSANGIAVHNCAEILLADRGMCNLSTVNIKAHVYDGYLDIDGLRHSFELATRVGLRMTNVDMSLPEWDSVQKRDRLIGVSMTGWMDAMEASPDNGFTLRWSDGSTSFQSPEEILASVQDVVDGEAIEYASEMRVPIPLLTTTVKPEGTLSQLPSVSQGMHRAWSPYFIRRVRIAAADPLARTMLHMGYPVYPETNQWNSGENDPFKAVEKFDSLSKTEQLASLEEADTWVVEFAQKSDAKVTSQEESGIDQLKRYFQFQKCYTAHNTSSTVYVGEDEWNEVTRMVYDNWDDFVAISFLPKQQSAYALAPYEEITQTEYASRTASVPTFNRDYLEKIEKEEWKEELIAEECEAGGVCPVR